MPASARLEGKVAIVTGAARGTGAAIARRFVAEGARVVIGDVLDDRGRELAAELGASALYHRLDVTLENDWGRSIAFALGHFGKLDALVNNAGVLHLASLEDTTPHDWKRVLDVNLFGPFLGMRAVGETLRHGGGGAIVNIASIDALEGMNGVAAYASSKWGLRGLAKCAAIELGKFGIRVNTICPGAGSFEMIQPFLPKDFDPAKLPRPSTRPILVAREPVSNARKLEEIGALAAFLCSDDASSITGADFAVDGGFTAGKIQPGAPGA
jgi:3alpha(or 20beta)-hydroxysteroid dehydrogenase